MVTPLRIAELLAIGAPRKPPRRRSWRWAWRVLFDRKARAAREQRCVSWAQLWVVRRDCYGRMKEWMDAALWRTLVGGTVIVGFDPAKPGDDRTVIAGRVIDTGLWT